VNPAARQIAVVSSRMRVTSEGETDAVIATLTTIGGGSGTRGLELRGAVSNAATVKPVAINILSAVDGRSREKFDVRSRENRAPAAHSVHVWDVVRACVRTSQNGLARVENW
jgi:hypothetical protein